MSNNRGLVVTLLTVALAPWGCQLEPDQEGEIPESEARERTTTPVDAVDGRIERQPAYFMGRDGHSLTSRDGEPIPVMAGAIEGSVDHWKIMSGTAALSGWSAAVERSEPADAIVVVRNGEVVATSAPNLHRPDVAEHFQNEALASSGFELEFPAEKGMEVRVYGVSGSSASELPYAEGYPWRPAS